ncbi:MAG: ComEA family DNA-binding protein [Clostridioides sp.]|jgi:competence protein ComEA|nr:ComEA family DNA-binding protein [Clostridioides sp.]
MNNKKIIIIVSVLILSVGTMVYRQFFYQGGMYVVSDAGNEENSKDEEEVNNDDEFEELDGSSKNEAAKTSNPQGEITVYISGEVINPGLVNIKNGSRLYDAVVSAGGTTENANLNAINLALKVEDGKHYIVPKIGEEVNYNVSNADISDVSSSGDTSNTSKININTADESELQKLDGVGEATAKKIIKYRTEKGPFKTINDIKNVSGIGDKKFEALKDSICVN